MKLCFVQYVALVLFHASRLNLAFDDRGIVLYIFSPPPPLPFLTRHRNPSALVVVPLVLFQVSKPYSHSASPYAPMHTFPHNQLLTLPSRTWVCHRDLGDLLFAHISPDWGNGNDQYGSCAANHDGVKVCRLVDRSPLHVSQRLLEEARGGANAGHDRCVAAGM
jgi:hypothetical protein